MVRDGENGYLVPAGDVPALATALERCLARRDDLASRAAASVQPFSLSAFEQKILGFYGRLVGSPPVTPG